MEIDCIAALDGRSRFHSAREYAGAQVSLAFEWRSRNSKNTITIFSKLFIDRPSTP